jgi:hypothetical protein
MQQEQYIHIDEYGDKRYYKDREMTIAHRLDGGPAIEYANGGKAWWIDGQLHRLDGPAIEDANGSKAWYVDGQRHRLDGPAVQYTDGSKAWFVDGKRLSEEAFNALTAPTLELTLEEIAAKFGVDASKIKIKK